MRAWAVNEYNILSFTHLTVDYIDLKICYFLFFPCISLHMFNFVHACLHKIYIWSFFKVERGKSTCHWKRRNMILSQFNKELSHLCCRLKNIFRYSLSHLKLNPNSVAFLRNILRGADFEFITFYTPTLFFEF